MYSDSNQQVYLVADNVAGVRCLVSQGLAAASVLVCLVLGLLSLRIRNSVNTSQKGELYTPRVQTTASGPPSTLVAPVQRLCRTRCERPGSTCHLKCSAKCVGCAQRCAAQTKPRAVRSASARRTSGVGGVLGLVYVALVRHGD